MQFERMALQEFAPGMVAMPEGKRVREFIPQYKGRRNQEEPEEPPPPPPPPTFSEAQLEAAREDAYRKGFNDGEKKGLSIAESEMAQVDKNIRELMQPITEQLLLLFTHYDHFILQQKKSTPLLAGAIARKIAGVALTQNPMANIETACIQCIDRMLGEAEIHIYVHPTLSDALEDRLAKHFAHSHEPGNVLIHKDAALTETGCRIEWQQGGLTYNPLNIMAQMDQLVLGVAGAAEHMHESVTVDNITEQVALSAPPVVPNAAEHEAVAVETLPDQISALPEDSAIETEAALASEGNPADIGTDNPTEDPAETPTDNPPENPKE